MVMVWWSTRRMMLSEGEKRGAMVAISVPLKRGSGKYLEI
jgi:hypothetical protein